MVYWYKVNGIGIDTAVFFVKLAIEEVVKTNFKPGGPVEIYKSTESGISPLIVIPRTTPDIEEYIWWEEVVVESQCTRNQSVALQMKNQIQYAPQETGMV